MGVSDPVLSGVIPPTNGLLDCKWVTGGYFTLLIGGITLVIPGFRGPLFGWYHYIFHLSCDLNLNFCSTSCCAFGVEEDVKSSLIFALLWVGSKLMSRLQ